MEIILKNGEHLNLDWNLVVIEYLEDYEGGIEKLKTDIESEEIPFRIFNFILYCFFSANYSKEIGYREAISLIEPNDFEKILDFVIEKIQSFNVENSKSKKIVTHRR